MALLNATPNTVQPNAFAPNVQEYVSTAGGTIQSVIHNPIHFPFRKLEIKRRLATTALYESDWYDITDWVVKWGTYQMAIDDLKLNQFNFSGLNVTVKNDYGEFNPEYHAGSLFYGYFSRYRTLVRLSAGYTDGSGTQFPSDASQGIYVMDANIDISPGNKEVRLLCKSIISPFQETRANEIDGITASITASQIIERIRDATDGAGHSLFQYFISSSAWTIQSTTGIITAFNTTSVLDDFSVWELMQSLAEAENFVIATTRVGGLVFGDRTPNTNTAQWSFYGQGYKDPDIISIKNYREATEKLFTNVRFKYQLPDTSSSFIESGTQTTVDISSNEWKYGRHTYEFENNLFSNTTTAEEVAANIANEFSTLKNELTIDTLFNPELGLLDRVEMNHFEADTATDNRWNYRVWATETTATDQVNVLFWADETTSTIDFYQKAFKIISKTTNLDNYVTTFILREI